MCYHLRYDEHLMCYFSLVAIGDRIPSAEENLAGNGAQGTIWPAAGEPIRVYVILKIRRWGPIPSYTYDDRGK